jgi:hypothetical protein
VDSRSTSASTAERVDKDENTHKRRKNTHDQIDTRENDTKPSLKGGCLNTFSSPYYEIVTGDKRIGVGDG